MRFPHWQFFESVDDELHSLSRIIEFAPENFCTFSVHLSRLYLSVGSEIDVVAKLLQPWLSWSSDTKPRWWESYNNVKHKRSKHYQEANLANVLESTAGLLVLLVYFHQPELYSKNPPIQPDFKTMRIDRKYAHILRWGFDYSLA